MFVFLNTLVWFLVLVMMATLLGKLGVTQFLAEALGEFASITAHISAMFFVFYSAELVLRSTAASLCFYYDSFR